VGASSASSGARRSASAAAELQLPPLAADLLDVTDETRLPRAAPVGGQAVLEGVMMRGVSTWSVAVRTPPGEIEVRSFPLVAWTGRHRVLRWPVVRGVVALAESLNIGFKALGISVNAQLQEDEEEEVSGAMWAGAIVAGLALAIGLFLVVPVTLTSLFEEQLGSAFVFWLVEGFLRTAIFLAYLSLLSRMRDLRRLFGYHGAEHKVISCFEAVGLPAWYVLIATRILGVPLIAGLSFEVIKWAGRNRAKGWVQTIMWPGMQLQKLTTREPDAAQLAVAVAALEAVLAVEDPRAASAADKVGMEVVA
jgi:uncharacterized protein YqhQ